MTWGNIVVDNPEKVFNDYFSSIFTVLNDELVMPVPSSQYGCNDSLNTLTVTEEMMLKALMNLNMNRATGSDNISPVVFKICCRELMTICLLYPRHGARAM